MNGPSGEGLGTGPPLRPSPSYPFFASVVIHHFHSQVRNILLYCLAVYARKNNYEIFKTALQVINKETFQDYCSTPYRVVAREASNVYSSVSRFLADSGFSTFHMYGTKPWYGIATKVLICL